MWFLYLLWFMFIIIVLCYSIIYIYNIDAIDLGLMGLKIFHMTYILSFSKPIIVSIVERCIITKIVLR